MRSACRKGATTGLMRRSTGPGRSGDYRQACECRLTESEAVEEPIPAGAARRSLWLQPPEFTPRAGWPLSRMRTLEGGH
jgi:hypothetical protein